MPVRPRFLELMFQEKPKPGNLADRWTMFSDREKQSMLKAWFEIYGEVIQEALLPFYNREVMARTLTTWRHYKMHRVMGYEFMIMDFKLRSRFPYLRIFLYEAFGLGFRRPLWWEIDGSDLNE